MCALSRWTPLRGLLVATILAAAQLAQLVSGAASALAESAGAKTAVQAERGLLPWHQDVTWQGYLERRPDGNAAFSLASLAAGSYSTAAALSLAEAAMLAYERSPVIDAAVKKWGFTGYQFLEAGGTQAFLAWNDAVLLVVFRGTDAKDDWLINLDVGLAKPGEWEIHRGFLKAFKGIDGPIRSALAQAGNKAVWIAGHSLGGALATVMAAELQPLLARARIVTFGQPCVGLEALKTHVDGAYAGRFHRFVNRQDPVTRVPIRTIWQHVERLYHIDHASPDGTSRGREPARMTPAEFEQFRREVKRLRAERRGADGSIAARRQPRRQGPARSLSDHGIVNYIHAIERLQ